MPSPVVLEALANMCAFTARAGDAATQQHSAEVFLEFLIQTAHISVNEYRPYGSQVWNSLHQNMKLVMSIPTRWGSAQRALVRSAAVRVLGVGTDASQIMFVTEAEVWL